MNEYSNSCYFNPHANWRVDSLSLGLTVGGISSFLYFLEKYVLLPLAKFLPEEPKNSVSHVQRPHTPNASNISSTASNTEKTQKEEIRQQQKFLVTASNFVSFIVIHLMAAYCLQGHGEWLLNPYKQNVQFKGSIPVGIRILYLTEAAYCLYTTFKMFTTPLKRDIYQMLAHHLVTLVLLGVSYYCTQLKYGICITLLHNLTTPIMDAAKLCNYFHLHKCANVIFMIFATLFFYLRVWIFPSQIIHAIYINETQYPYYKTALICLIGLWLLHLRWSYMICKVFHRSLILGNRQGDIRETD